MSLNPLATLALSAATTPTLSPMFAQAPASRQSWGHERYRQWREMTSSALVQDSLRALTGGDLPRLRFDPRNQPTHRGRLVDGMYTPPRDGALDEISMYDWRNEHPSRPPTASRNRHVLLHEFGHAVERRGHGPTPNSPQDLDLLKSFFRTEDKWPNTYAATNPREHFAERFASAFNFLSTPYGRYRTDQGGTPLSYEKSRELFESNLSFYETQEPGFAAMTRHLLSHRLYANHWYNRKPKGSR